MIVKPIPRFSAYSVDENGNIFNSSGLKLKLDKSNRGYLRVTLRSDAGERKKLLVHRIVAETFVPNPLQLPCVNHKDEDKQNNAVSNLEWCTHLDNLLYSGVIRKASKANEHKVICLSTGETFDSIKEASDKHSVHHSNLVACCKGRRKTCGGMTWRYADDKKC